jgi:hypothetical protein
MSREKKKAQVAKGSIWWYTLKDATRQKKARVVGLLLVIRRQVQIS